jgi:hypothetical protein
MARKVFYRNCRLSNPQTDGRVLNLMSYIPEPYCVRGKVLKLRDEDGTWGDGWVVDVVGDERREGHDIPDAHDLIKAHLRATGDAEPKG